MAEKETKYYSNSNENAEFYEEDGKKYMVKMDEYPGGAVKTWYRKLPDPQTQGDAEKLKEAYEDAAGKAPGNFRYCAPFNPRTYQAQEAGDILCDQDVAVKMRDGVTLYADIFRPNTTEKVPLIISWGFFGKRPGEGLSDWKTMGVPSQAMSTMAKFESADPAFWCRHGYAVANVDCRGAGYSEGDMQLWGIREAQDGYDFIEWAAEQHWCNGKVGMSGNSGVAMVQWRIASLQPPHLACIAPWEGTSDVYRELLFEGGIPARDFIGGIVDRTIGVGYIDDMIKMAEEYPLMNPYWEDKVVDFKNIVCPVYTTGCWNHLHLRGSVNAFRRIKSHRKWIRIHREFEWADYYCPEGLADLKLFFDRYLKEIRNGWEFTPKVRVDVQDLYDHNFMDERAEEAFPIKRTQYKKLYLNAADLSMSDEPIAEQAKASYDSQTGQLEFDYTFPEDTEITGYMKLHAWVEAEGHDDMDIFVNIQKADAEGNFVPVTVCNQPHPGAWGKMRVSHRKLDEKLSTDWNPVQAHTVEEKLSPGEIVPFDMEIYPHSRFFHKGERIRVQIAGRYIREEGWFERLVWYPDNHGDHVIHTGGEHDTYLQIPVIPPRYQVGDVIVR